MSESEPAGMVSGGLSGSDAVVTVGETLAGTMGAGGGEAAPGHCDHASRELRSPDSYVAGSVPADGTHDDHCACGVSCHAFCSSPGGVAGASEAVGLAVFATSSVRHEQAVDLIAAPLPRLLFRPPKQA